ncbi:MAG TPA: ArsR family transcriptional regulator [Marmoricola sp.]|nr:ArsR family transcriptional regulator [Marmoricola sp.]
MSSGARTSAPPEFLRLAGHPLRWRLMSALADSDLRVRELAELVDEPQNLVSYHLRLLRSGGVVTASRSSFDGRDSYYRLDLDRCAAGLAAVGRHLHPSVSTQPLDSRPPASRGPAVLFVCTGNSVRSPMAEALLRHHTGGRLVVGSAGVAPRARFDPEAVRVLQRRLGVDLRSMHPRHITAVEPHRFDHVVTLCDRAREHLPELPQQPRRLHWSTPDPAAAAGTPAERRRAFRRIADDIESRVRHLVPALLALTTEEDQG